MRLGLGLGFSKGSVIVNDLVAWMMGDSTEEYHFTQYTAAGEAEFESVAGGFFATANAVDAARTGTFLLESTALENNAGNTNLYWVDNSASLANGPQITNNIVNLAGTPNIGFLSLGINDNNSITTETSTDFANAYGFLADAAKSNKNIVTFVNTLGRDTGGDDGDCNTIMQGILTAIESNSNIRRGVDVYDLALTDAKHHTEAGQEAKAEREATRAANFYGKTSVTGLGPSIVSAELHTDEIIINLSHENGTDITAPSSGDGGFDAEDDGTAMGASALTRVDATTAKLAFPQGKAPVSGSVVKLFAPYGANGGGLNGAAPDVMKDNSSLTLPIQRDIVTCSNEDPIQALDNLAIYFDVRGSVKTLATLELEAVAKIAGTIASASEAAAGTHATWDEVNAFALRDVTRLLYTGFTAGVTHSIGIVMEAPDPYSAVTKNLFSFGNSSAATDQQARLVSSASDGALYWNANEASGVSQVGPVLTSGGQVILLLEFVDTDELNGYYTNWSTPDHTLDPRNTTDYENWDSIIIGARTIGSNNDALDGLKIKAWFHTTDVLTPAEKSSIFSYWSSRFS